MAADISKENPAAIGEVGDKISQTKNASQMIFGMHKTKPHGLRGLLLSEGRGLVHARLIRGELEKRNSDLKKFETPGEFLILPNLVIPLGITAGSRIWAAQS